MALAPAPGERASFRLRLSRPLRVAWILLGILELAGAALWCLAGAGLYGSPLASMERSEAIKACAFLIVGPASVLPSAWLALRHPALGIFWVIAGGLASGCMIGFVIPHPAMRGALRFETALPLALATVPMLAVGAAGLWQMRRGTR